MRAIGRFLVSRLQEPSTWAGLSVIATIVGVPPGTMDALHMVVVGAIGLGAVLIPETGKPAPAPAPAPAQAVDVERGGA